MNPPLGLRAIWGGGDESPVVWNESLVWPSSSNFNVAPYDVNMEGGLYRGISVFVTDDYTDRSYKCVLNEEEEITVNVSTNPVLGPEIDCFANAATNKEWSKLDFYRDSELVFSVNVL